MVGQAYFCYDLVKKQKKLHTSHPSAPQVCTPPDSISPTSTNHVIMCSFMEAERKTLPTVRATMTACKSPTARNPASLKGQRYFMRLPTQDHNSNSIVQKLRSSYLHHTTIAIPEIGTPRS